MRAKGKTMRMMSMAMAMILVITMTAKGGLSKKFGETTQLLSWVTAEFDWEGMGESKEEWTANGWYIPENCVPAGVKQYKDDLYITVPRWMPGVPATLTKLVKTSNGSSALLPFPSLSVQDIYSSPSSPQEGVIRYVQDVEIDGKGRMWVIDTGMMNLFLPSEYSFHQPQLIIYDLTVTPPKEIYRYSFPPSLAAANVTFLNDLVIDQSKEIAYISNAAGNGGIYAFDFREKKMIRFWSDRSTMAEEGGNLFVISGVSYDFGFIPSDGIALSPDTSLLFYCALSGFSLYSLDTSVFSDPSASSSDISKTVIKRGEKKSQSDGIAFDSKNNLYMGDIGNNAVNYWALSSSSLTSSNQKLLYKNDSSLQWQDTFAFDNRGSLLVMSNRLQLFPGKIDFTGASGANFNLFSIYIDANSYLAGDESATEYSTSDATLIAPSFIAILLVLFF